MDAVFYLLEALWLFRGKSLEVVREIAFEIGMLGQYGLDEAIQRRRMSSGLLSGKGFFGSGATVHHISQACRGSSRGWKKQKRFKK
jgi:hypothetical protein